MSEEEEFERYERTQEIVGRVRDAWETERRGVSVQWQEDGQTVHVMPEDGRRYGSFEKVAAEVMHTWRAEKNAGDLGRNRKEKYVILAADKMARNRSWIID